MEAGEFSYDEWNLHYIKYNLSIVLRRIRDSYKVLKTTFLSVCVGDIPQCRSEGNLWEFVFSSLVGCGDWTQALRLGGRHLYCWVISPPLKSSSLRNVVHMLRGDMMMLSVLQGKACWEAMWKDNEWRQRLHYLLRAGLARPSTPCCFLPCAI